MGGAYWSPEDIDRLKALYPVKGWPVLLREFPARSKASIRCKVISLDIKKEKNSRVPWLDSEFMTLRKLWPNASWDHICAAIPRHSKTAIARQASFLKLRRDGAKNRSRYRIIRELREIRRNSGVPREKVAASIGCHVVQLARWETGEQYPRIAGFFDWVEALGYRLELRKAA